MRSIYPTVFVLAFGAMACAHKPKPYSFTTEQASDDVDLVVHTLVASGLQPATIDRKGGAVTTRWFDTGYRFRENDINSSIDQYTDIFLRHRITIERSSGKDSIRLETDVQRCSPTDSLVTATEVHGTCMPLAVLFPTQQKQIDQLGERLRRALAGSAPVASRM